MTEAEGLRAIWYLQQQRRRVIEELELQEDASGEWEVVATVAATPVHLRDYAALERWVEELPA